MSDLTEGGGLCLIAEITILWQETNNLIISLLIFLSIYLFHSLFPFLSLSLSLSLSLFSLSPSLSLSLSLSLSVYLSIYLSVSSFVSCSFHFIILHFQSLFLSNFSEMFFFIAFSLLLFKGY